MTNWQIGLLILMCFYLTAAIVYGVSGVRYSNKYAIYLLALAVIAMVLCFTGCESQQITSQAMADTEPQAAVFQWTPGETQSGIWYITFKATQKITVLPDDDEMTLIDIAKAETFEELVAKIRMWLYHVKKEPE